MRACGRRTAKERARVWLLFDAEGSRDGRLGAGEELPDAELGWEVGPMGIPLYSAWGEDNGISVVDNGRLFLASNASNTLTMAWRCSVRFSWHICTFISAWCSCRHNSVCFSNHHGGICRSQIRHRTGGGGGWCAGSSSPASASMLRWLASTSAPDPKLSTIILGRSILSSRGSTHGLIIHIVCTN